MKIVVLAGGLSGERNVSLCSGTMVCAALRRLGHQAVLTDLFLGLEDDPRSPAEQFADLAPLPPVGVSAEVPDLDAVRASRRWQSKSIFGQGVLELCQAADVVFLALHGVCGEDGRVQAAFDLLGIPYTGSGYLGSGMAMDKTLTKLIMRANGIRTPDWESVTYTAEDIPALSARLPIPCVVKIPRNGSSIGVWIVRKRAELASVLAEALPMADDATVLVEQFIEGKDLTCAVLGERALPSVEILPKVDFYDYANKYQAGATEEICPARIAPALEREMGELALRLHRALGLAVYSRTDFMLTEDGELYCLEINTLPGMTATSLVPQEAAAVGMSYDELCQYIVEQSLLVRQGQ